MSTNSTLEAGPKLDARVAEKVMGWHDIEPPRRAAGGFGSPWQGKPPGKRRLSDRREFPKFSDDITAAWDVMEKFRVPLLWQDAEGWTCRLNADDNKTLSEATADTAPLAICLAALKALESR